MNRTRKHFLLAGALLLTSQVVDAQAADQIDIYFFGAGEHIDPAPHAHHFLLALHAKHEKSPIEWEDHDRKDLVGLGGNDTRRSFPKGLVGTNIYRQQRVYRIGGTEVVLYKEDGNQLQAIGVVGDDDTWLLEMAETAAEAIKRYKGYDEDAPYNEAAADATLAFATRVHRAGDGIFNVQYAELEQYYARAAFVDHLLERGYASTEGDSPLTPEVAERFSEAVVEMETGTLTTFDDEKTGQILADRGLEILEGLMGIQVAGLDLSGLAGTLGTSEGGGYGAFGQDG